MKLGIAVAACALLAHSQDADHGVLAARMKEAALSYTDRLRDFTCTQFLKRSAGPSPDGPHWKLLDTQEAELDYVGHKEHYTLLQVNGQSADPAKRIKRGPYLTPGGEFGTFLQKIFNPKAQAEFAWDHQEGDGPERACAFRYNVPLATTTEVIQVNSGRVPVGHHGMVWADCDTGVVKRFRFESDFGEAEVGGRRVPVGFHLEVRFTPATIGSQQFLLPDRVEETSLFYKTWTKVEIQFQQYRKYDASSTISFDGHY